MYLLNQKAQKFLETSFYLLSWKAHSGKSAKMLMMFQKIYIEQCDAFI